MRKVKQALSPLMSSKLTLPVNLNLRVLNMKRPLLDDEEEEGEEETTVAKTGVLKQAFDKTHWAWIIIIVFGLVVQGLRSATMSVQRRHFIGTCQVRSATF